jgi:hypothetical protein
LTTAKETFEGWCVLELMGHRKLGGYVREQDVAGSAFIRIDVPGESGPVATQLYAPGAVYCITPTTEEIARALAKSCRPEPVTRWELPAQTEPARPPRMVEHDPFRGTDPFGGEEDEDP